MKFKLMVTALILMSCESASYTTSYDNAPTQPTPLKSGTEFLTPETRALQSDSFANPAFLWVDRGETLFFQTPISGQACSNCHTESVRPLKDSATQFPKFNSKTQTLFNLEAQINYCRVTYQQEPQLAYETEDLLALTAYTASRSKGRPLTVAVTQETESNFKNGRDYFFTRRGQMNFSCTQCHDRHWGQKLRGDTISQGHGNGFPAYRLEWESLGSLHRRLSDCDRGVRAEPLPLGSQTYIDLEFYLAVRATGLAVETPAIRR